MPRAISLPSLMETPGEIIEVVRTYLELNSCDESAASFISDERVQILQVRNCPASFHRYLYAEVGRHYHWVDRLQWTDERILTYLDDPNLELWVMYREAAPAGYFEMLKCEDGSIEIAYFGLMPEFIGQGLGKHLLCFAINRAWETETTRIWLHTCSLDDPAAMPNYLKRGFRPFKQETYSTTLGTQTASKAGRT